MLRVRSQLPYAFKSKAKFRYYEILLIVPDYVAKSLEAIEVFLSQRRLQGCPQEAILLLHDFEAIFYPTSH